MKFALSRNELKEIRSVAAAIDYGLLPDRCFGWTRVSKRTPVYRKGDLILKNPNFILNDKTPIKFRVPTIKIRHDWVVQPYCQKIRTKLAATILRKQMGNLMCDLHAQNVGWYKGKPVMFDW